MANAVVPFEHQVTLADSIAKSSLFGIKTRDQALVLMALCEAEGLHPIVACRDFNIIQGRPALKADAMLTRFQAAGGKVRWTSYTDENVTGEFSHPQGGIVVVDWTMERAHKAGLAGKGPWQQYPRAMLRARVISEAIRTVFPGVLSGLYTPEEEEQDTESSRQVRDITPARLPAADLDAFAGDDDQGTVDPDVGASGQGTAPSGTRIDPDPGGAQPLRIPVGIKDGVSDWGGWCAAVKEAYLAAKDEAQLQAIRDHNKDALGSLAGGGKGGKAAAERLQAVFTGIQTDMWRKAAEQANT